MYFYLCDVVPVSEEVEASDWPKRIITSWVNALKKYQAQAKAGEVFVPNKN